MFRLLVLPRLSAESAKLNVFFTEPGRQHIHYPTYIYIIYDTLIIKSMCTKKFFSKVILLQKMQIVEETLSYDAAKMEYGLRC